MTVREWLGSSWWMEGGPGHSTTRGQWGRRNEETRLVICCYTDSAEYIFFCRQWPLLQSRYVQLGEFTEWRHAATCRTLSRITADTLQLSSLWRGDTNLPGLCDEIDGAMCPLSRCHGAGEAATEERGGETWLREYKSGHQAVNTRGGSPGNTTEGDKVNISLN